MNWTFIDYYIIYREKKTKQYVYLFGVGWIECNAKKQKAKSKACHECWMSLMLMCKIERTIECIIKLVLGGNEWLFITFMWHIVIMQKVQLTVYALELIRECIERVLKWGLFEIEFLLPLPWVCQFHCRLQTQSNIALSSNFSQYNLIDFVDWCKMRSKGWF